jgi:hypothetical protein
MQRLFAHGLSSTTVLLATRHMRLELCDYIVYWSYIGHNTSVGLKRGFAKSKYVIGATQLPLKSLPIAC